MKLNTFILLLLFISMQTNAQQPNGQATIQKKYQYPLAHKDTITDHYFGIPVEDPYRWLEDDRSEATKKWVDQENAFTESILRSIPDREQIRSRLTELWNYPRQSSPFRMGKYYFFYSNEGMQNQNVLNLMTSLSAKSVIFIDPNSLSPDGTTSLTSLAMHKDSRYFSYGISRAGSDWNDFIIRDMSTNKVLDDTLHWVKFSGMAWYKDGFYYSRYDQPSLGDKLKKKNEFQKIYYHKAGTPQHVDKLIYEDTKNPQKIFGAQVTYDETYLIISSSISTSGNDLVVTKLTDPGSNYIQLFSGYDFDRTVIDNDGTDLLVLTNEGAPNRKLIRINPENPQIQTDLIPEDSSSVLESVTLTGRMLVARYMHNATNYLVVFNRSGIKQDTIHPPVLASIESITGHPEDNFFFFSVSSFTYPSVIYRYDIASKKSTEFYRPKLNFDFDQYETSQVWYKSYCGTSVPMFLVYKKGIHRNGTNPVFLYGYGGFNISLTPNFSPWRLVLLERGFIYAMPNLRGGGEFGEKWHKAGTKENKQNVFNDFISAAEFLISNRFTDNKYIAIHGRSNGGLLVGACMTQRPDLFQVALPGVGVLDMLRYQKFTIGWAWASDYGTSDDSKMIKYLLSYSPYHKINQGINYPATLITTADHDDRVVPAHSFKFAAMLQALDGGKNPQLIRIEKSAGHGAGKSTSKQIDEWTDIISFTTSQIRRK